MPTVGPCAMCHEVVSGHNLVTRLYIDSVWLVVDLGIAIKMTKQLKDIGPHAPSLLTILASILNIVEGDLYDHLIRRELSH